MGHTEELSDFQHGIVIGCHLSNKSVRQISALLELPRSTVSAVIVKWKRLGTTTAQPRSGKPYKLADRLSLVATLTTEFQSDSGSNVSTSTVRRELHQMGFMAEQPHTSLRSPCAMPSASWSGVTLTAIRLWSSGNTFSLE